MHSSSRKTSFPYAVERKATPLPFERKDDLALALISASNDIRFRVAKAVRALMVASSKSAITREDRAGAPKSIKNLAEVLRNTAALVDSIHELARGDSFISSDIGTIVDDVVDLVDACKDFEALRYVDPANVVRVSRSLDNAAQVVEKSEEMLDLVSQLDSVELGVNNLGISRDEFRRLAGEAPPAETTFDAVPPKTKPLESLGVSDIQAAEMKVLAISGEPIRSDLRPADLLGRSGGPALSALPRPEYLPRPTSDEFETLPYEQARQARLEAAQKRIEVLDAKRLGDATYQSETELSATGVFDLKDGGSSIPVEMTTAFREAGETIELEEAPPATDED